MTPDQTPLWEYTVAAVGFTVVFLALPVFWLARERWRQYAAWNRLEAAKRDLQVHANVTVLHQRSAR